MGLYDSYVLQLEKGSACKEQITQTKTELTNQRPCLYNHCPIKACLGHSHVPELPSSNHTYEPYNDMIIQNDLEKPSYF